MTKLRLHRRLSVQLVAMLTLALLPLGTIALFQTQRVAAEVEQAAGLAVLGLTERAARGEQLLIERAVGAARLFGKIAPDLIEHPEDCAPMLSPFVAANPEYSFIGVQPLSGISQCSSSREAQDFRALPNFAEAMAAQGASITVNGGEVLPGTSDFVVSEPFEVNGEFSGFISVFIPHKSVPETSEKMEELGLVDLMTFNDNGTILTVRSSTAIAAQELPSDRTLASLSVNRAQTFRAVNAAGIERRYSIVTIEGSPAAVLAVWRADEGVLGTYDAAIPPAIFPILMWIASMAVAMLAVNTLILRHITRLRRRMDEFSDTRRVAKDSEKASLIPLEIENLEQNFQRMSEEILNDEARRENALREKGVLVKEIHHRVKNNLQLISSIMNMQIRAAEHDETRTTLRRVQERVLSLATIHRDLYQSPDSGQVQVGRLIEEMVEKSKELFAEEHARLDVRCDIAPVQLYPDQAVPLSLLVAEATTNAMKYGATGELKKPILEVKLKQEGNICKLVVANTTATTPRHEGTGLGAKLMRAFALQLGGQIEVTETSDRYTMTLEFPVQEFELEARDF